ncbi:NAD(P)-binding protein [Trichoderma longibrachiatum]
MPYPYKDEITGPELVAEYAPIIKGKTILTTGVSPNSLGAHYVETIAAGQPKLLILAGRDLAKVNQTAETVNKRYPDVQTRVLQLDLGSFAAVRRAAAEVNSWDDVPAIDVLMNNAGIMAVPYRICEDGYESQLTCNHLGHFLLTNLIFDKLLASADKRVVNVSSGGHWFSAIRYADINYDGGETYEKWNAYGQSKTANVLFSLGLANKFGDRGVLAYSLNPGAIATTNLAAHLDFAPGGDLDSLARISRLTGSPFGWMEKELLSYDRGVATHIFASFDPVLKDHNGKYLVEKARVADYYVDPVHPHAISDIEADKLWELSVKAVGL